MVAFDEQLRSLLEAEGNRVAPDGSRRDRSIARVGRRRVVRTWGAAAFAAIVALAAISGGGAIVSVFDRYRAAQPASPSYYVLGTGAHDGRNWVLRVGTDSGREEVVFEIEGPAPNEGAFETHTGWERIDASFQGRVAGAGEYVMGMVDRDAASVTVVLDDAQVDAQVFGDGPVRYFLAFVPRDARGVVVARSDTGEILGSSVLSGARGGGGMELGCPRDHVTEDELGDDRFPVLGRGTFDGRRWIVSLIEDPDAAHPEDTESDNPELAFEIEGPWPNAGTMETYGRWEGVSEPFYDGLSGDDAYLFGMASADAGSVTVEPREGDAVEAELFDARDVPSPGAQVYVAFVPAGTTGDVVARDAAGAVIAREPLRAPPDVSLCE